MNPERLAKLAEAREKAVAKRRLLGELARKEKAARDKQLQDRLAAADAVLAGDATKAPSPAPAQTPAAPAAAKAKRAKKPPQPSSSSSSTSEASSSDEDEAPRSRRAPAPKYRPSKGAAAVAPTPRAVNRALTEDLTAAIAREELEKRIARQNYEDAFRSIFPGYRLM